jgi:hypothetical protein
MVGLRAAADSRTVAVGKLGSDVGIRRRYGFRALTSIEVSGSGANVMDTVGAVGFALIFHRGPKKEGNFSATGSGVPVTSLQFVQIFLFLDGGSFMGVSGLHSKCLFTSVFSVAIPVSKVAFSVVDKISFGT